MYQAHQHQHQRGGDEYGGIGRWRGGGQEWTHHGFDDHIHLVNVGNSHVIDVDHAKDTDNAALLVYPKKVPGAPNQQWRLEPVGNNKFYIVSALNPNMVIDVPYGKTKSGTKCILLQKVHPAAQNQLWEWQGDTIHSSLGHDLVLAQHGGDHGTLIVETRNGKDNQAWRQERN